MENKARYVCFTSGFSMTMGRGHSDNWKLTEKEKGRFWIGLSFCFFGFAAYAYFYPSPSSLNGRWGWLHHMFFEAFGNAGEVVMYCLLGVAALGAGVSYLSSKMAMKP